MPLLAYRNAALRRERPPGRIGQRDLERKTRARQDGGHQAKDKLLHVGYLCIKTFSCGAKTFVAVPSA